MKSLIGLNVKGNKTLNEETVIQHLNNLLYTRVGEIPFNREFGTYLEDFLFELDRNIVKKKIKLELKRAITRWIPYIEVTGVDVSFNEDKEEYNVKLYIYVPELNFNMEYNTAFGVN